MWISYDFHMLQNTILLIYKFLLWNRLTRSCKNSTEKSCVPFIRCPPEVISVAIQLMGTVVTMDWHWWNPQTVFRHHQFYVHSFVRVCVYVHTCACLVVCYSTTCAYWYNYQQSQDAQRCNVPPLQRKQLSMLPFVVAHPPASCHQERIARQGGSERCLLGRGHDLSPLMP